MRFEHSIDISADAKTVFHAYQNVSEWSQWDPETEAASIDGDFTVGTTGTIKPKGAPKSKMKLIEVTEDRSFTVECGLPLCKMHFIHLINPGENGTNLVNQIEFSGILGPVFAKLVGKSISKTLPESLAGLKRHIENES